MIDGFQGLRHHAVISRYHQHGNIGYLCPAGAHGRKGLVSGSIEENNLPSLIGNLISADMLGNAPGFARRYIGFANSVEQRSFTMVDMAHHRDYRRARQALRGIVFHFRNLCRIPVGFLQSDLHPKFLTDEQGGIIVNILIDGYHHAQHEKRLDNFVDFAFDQRGKILDINALVHLHINRPLNLHLYLGLEVLAFIGVAAVHLMALAAVGPAFLSGIGTLQLGFLPAVPVIFLASALLRAFIPALRLLYASAATACGIAARGILRPACSLLRALGMALLAAACTHGAVLARLLPARPDKNASLALLGALVILLRPAAGITSARRKAAMVISGLARALHSALRPGIALAAPSLVLLVHAAVLQSGVAGTAV